MKYDPAARNGWARGLIHFHTDFSDGGATVEHAAQIAQNKGYNFLIVTDHLQNLPRQGHTFDEYIDACDRASSPDLLVIPGGEIEVGWTRGDDHSEAHTLAMSIRPLLNELVWDPKQKPYAHWADTDGKGTILAIQEMLERYGLPPAASHPFQHSYLGASIHPDEHADYRYDLERLRTSQMLDFFYSGVIDAAHEPEDLTLYLWRLAALPEPLPALYASCDYHYGPELHSLVGKMLLYILKKFKPFHVFQFAAEQLSHVTYVYIGNTLLTEETLIQALREGRTCVTRGEADFSDLQPVPSGTPLQTSSVELHLKLCKSYSVHRPRIVLVYRDGDLIHWQPVPDQEQAIELSWTDPAPPPGVHNYMVYVPSKFVSSPVLVDVQ